MNMEGNTVDNQLELKKKIFYLIHESAKGLSFTNVQSKISINEKKLKNLLTELECEAMIYLNKENVYNSVFKIVKHEDRERETKEKKIKFYEKILEETGLTKDEISNLVAVKKEELRDLISDDGALFIIAKELGVIPRHDPYQDYQNNIPFYGFNKYPLSKNKPSMIFDSKGKLTTGSVEFDALLCGGFELGSVYEIFADFAVGKTFLSQQLCINVQIPHDKGGLEASALYVDNEGTSALLLKDRVYNMTANLEINHVQALKNIIIARAYNSDHLVQIIKEAPSVIKENNIKLLIVDGIISHITLEYLPSSEEMEDSEILIENLFSANASVRSLLSDLHKLAKNYNLIVVFTYAERFVRERGLGNPFKPVGGTILAQENHTRIYFKKGRGDVRVAHLVHSPTLPLGYAEFYFSDYGISDI